MAESVGVGERGNYRYSDEMRIGSSNGDMPSCLAEVRVPKRE